MATLLRIVAVPDGEAPLWVRQKWIGLSLPLAQPGKSAQTFLTGGVLTGSHGFFSWLLAGLFGRLKAEAGFLVEVEAAVAALAVKSPEAAAWWRENTPYLLQPGQTFVFQQQAAQTYESDE